MAGFQFSCLSYFLEITLNNNFRKWNRSPSSCKVRDVSWERKELLHFVFSKAKTTEEKIVGLNYYSIRETAGHLSKWKEKKHSRAEKCLEIPCGLHVCAILQPEKRTWNIFRNEWDFTRFVPRADILLFSGCTLGCLSQSRSLKYEVWKEPFSRSNHELTQGSSLCGRRNVFVSRGIILQIKISFSRKSRLFVPFEIQPDHFIQVILFSLFSEVWTEFSGHLVNKLYSGH